MFFYHFDIPYQQNPSLYFFIPQISENQGAISPVSQTSNTSNLFIANSNGTHQWPNTYQQYKLLAEGASACQSSQNNEGKAQTKETLDENAKKVQSQQQFKPYNPQIKKVRKTPQNSNRNVVPNIMHQVISFMQKKKKSGTVVERIINRLGLQSICSVKRYYLYQLLIKDKLNFYVNTESLLVLRDIQQTSCEIYSEEEQRQYNKISRMLAEYFLKHEFDSIILTSQRVNAQKRFDHLRIKRKILDKISEMLD